MELVLEVKQDKSDLAQARTAARKKDAPRKAREKIAGAFGEPGSAGWENLGTLLERSGWIEIRKDSENVRVRRNAGA